LVGIKKTDPAHIKDQGSAVVDKLRFIHDTVAA